MLASPYTAAQQAAPGESAAKTSTRAAAEFGKGFGKFSGRFVQGALVEMPLAIAEGLRSVPNLYGEEVQPHKDVTDAASGFVVGGKNFVHGMVDGVAGLVEKPKEGLREGGALGLAAGMGKGVLGLVTKTGSAAVGIIAYPGQGIAKTVVAPFKAATRKSILSRRAEEGQYLARIEGLDCSDLIRKFDTLVYGYNGGADATSASPYIV